MDKFKYQVLLAPGERVLEYKKSLIELGYHGGVNGSTYAVKTYSDNAFLGFGSRLVAITANYRFLEQEPWQYDAALAIAAIQSEEGYHIGEWVKFIGVNDNYHDPKFYSDLWTIGDLYKVGKNEPRMINKMGNLDFAHFLVFKKASPEEIIEFFKQKHSNMPKSTNDTFRKNSTDRKVVGYRIIKDGPGFKKGLELKTRIDSKPEINYMSWVADSPKHRVKFPLSILEQETEWFEPIYENIVKTEGLEIGNQSLTVLIDSEGHIVANGSEIAIADLKRIRNWFTNPARWTLGGYDITYLQDFRFIRVGCIDKNNLFSPDEIARVIAVYNRLNP